MVDESSAPATDSQKIDSIDGLSADELDRVEVVDDGYVLHPEKSESQESPAKDPEKEEEKVGDEKAASKETPAENTDNEPETVEEYLNRMRDLKIKADSGEGDEFQAELDKLKDDPYRKALWDGHVRNAGLQKGFSEERKQRRAAEKSVMQRKRDASKQTIEGFVKLSDEALLELKENDVDAYVEYHRQLDKIEAKKTAFDTQEADDAQVEQISEFGDFLFEQFNFSIGEKTTQADIDKIFSKDVSRKVDDKLADLFGSDIVYNSKQIAAVYDHVMKDENLIQERVKARQNLKESMENAESGHDSSRLDQGEKGKRIKPQKTLEETSIDEIAAMGREEFASSFPSA